MSILAAIRREQKKARKKLAKLQHQLSGLEAAAKALGDSTNHELKSVTKRVLSAAGRAAIARAAKKRWARVRAKAKKLGG
jgi:DNA repair exonuclease SbcCD ATPase subunit